MNGAASYGQPFLERVYRFAFIFAILHLDRHANLRFASGTR